MNLYPAASKGEDDAQRAQMLLDAIILRRELRKNSNNFSDIQQRPTLLVLCGLPGTGKTYFSREVTKLVPFCVFESDRVRKTLVSEPTYAASEHARVFNVCHFLIEEYLSQGQNILFDATNLTEKFRLPLREISQRQDARLVMVHITAPRATVRQRLQERELGLHSGEFSDAGWLIYSRMAPHDQPIEGEHLSADTSKDISPIIENIVSLVTAPRN